MRPQSGVAKAFIVCMLLAGPIPTTPLQSQTYEYVVWTRADTFHDFMTAYTPVIWFQGYEKFADSRNTNGLQNFRESGILPLVWRSGRSVVTAETKPQELAEHWMRHSGIDGLGVGIDEFGHVNRITDNILAEALAIVDAQYPDEAVYIWHAGPVNTRFAKAYRSTSAKIMLEIYTSDTSFMAISIGWRLATARQEGFINRTLVAFRVDDSDASSTNGSSAIDILKKQMAWCKKYYPDIAGFAFFAPRASDALLEELNSFVLDFDTSQDQSRQ